MHRILVTGANGFAGQKLCKMLSNAGHHVIALTYGERHSAVQADEHLRCDIRDASAMAHAVEKAYPSHVVHLAAITHVATSFENPVLTWQTNVIGSVNLLEALRQHAPDAFTLFVSSSEVYGASFQQGTPLGEATHCQPMNPYAASKLAAETAFREYFRRGLFGAIARPFNHIGPGQSATFVAASFARQIAQIEAGKQAPVLKVGNLEAYRDFLDVDDVCDAYAKLLLFRKSSGNGKCFNICSGRPRKISEILEVLLNFSRIPITIETEPSRMRPSDISYATGSNARLCATIDWRASYDLSLTLGNLLDYWRAEAVS
ncbi:GDP-6-deoxy-D-lyxo-4-hexulose reductase [Stutzerimonas zhaodongensis]|uniref:GDP-6-deoxy-D-lyxo-4-hexulose reductase n=1 Tax=Stutzerimonas zhaodongensis TaxID=1176257 RepID=A0A365PTC5_9GAMM|nr:GDP-mannose 4,6-dehydratase [Stutzerimonas zhaodongensis]RBA56870.1 GDP-6-deoxy-D-lyxo-4-hexulose reductase [Stutzerimonas zhaodongensis]